MSILCLANSTVFKAKALLQIWQESSGRKFHQQPAVLKLITMMSNKFDVSGEIGQTEPMEVDNQSCNSPTEEIKKEDAIAVEDSFECISKNTGDSKEKGMLDDTEVPRTGRKKTFETLSSLNSNLYFDVSGSQWPIIYSDNYNISFWNLEKLHPFDAGKWGKVFQILNDNKMLHKDVIVEPKEAQHEDLRVVHSEIYLESLQSKMNMAMITEIPPVAIMPSYFINKHILKPFRYHTGGTILAGKLAVERGWAINIGGGFHHCSAEKGGGFCALADITLCIKFLLERKPEKVSKVMIVDLDAHQGNGHERDFRDDDRVYIMDVYNRGIYPFDGYAKRAIKKKVELPHKTGDKEYLEAVTTNLKEALQEFKPDLIVYNAGTDVLEGDPLGNLKVSANGIIERDEIVFRNARGNNIPIVMMTSGGYTKATAEIIANSILNLKDKELISCKEAEEAAKLCHAKDKMTPPTSSKGFFSWFYSSSEENRESSVDHHDENR